MSKKDLSRFYRFKSFFCFKNAKHSCSLPLLLLVPSTKLNTIPLRNSTEKFRQPKPTGLMTIVTDSHSERIPLSTMEKATTTRWGRGILWDIQQSARQGTVAWPPEGQKWHEFTKMRKIQPKI